MKFARERFICLKIHCIFHQVSYKCNKVSISFSSFYLTIWISKLSRLSHFWLLRFLGRTKQFYSDWLEPKEPELVTLAFSVLSRDFSRDLLANRGTTVSGMCTGVRSCGRGTFTKNALLRARCKVQRCAMEGSIKFFTSTISGCSEGVVWGGSQ